MKFKSNIYQHFKIIDIYILLLTTGHIGANKTQNVYCSHGSGQLVLPGLIMWYEKSLISLQVTTPKIKLPKIKLLKMLNELLLFSELGKHYKRSPAFNEHHWKQLHTSAWSDPPAKHYISIGLVLVARATGNNGVRIVAQMTITSRYLSGKLLRHLSLLAGHPEKKQFAHR